MVSPLHIMRCVWKDLQLQLEFDIMFEKYLQRPLICSSQYTTPPLQNLSQPTALWQLVTKHGGDDQKHFCQISTEHPPPSSSSWSRSSSHLFFDQLRFSECWVPNLRVQHFNIPLDSLIPLQSWSYSFWNLDQDYKMYWYKYSRSLTVISEKLNRVLDFLNFQEENILRLELMEGGICMTDTK